MVCLFAMLAAFFPRIGTLLIWLARPTMFSAAFNGSWLWPILGIVFLPFTTLMYVVLWTPGIGLSVWDWMWLVLAVFIDIAHWGQTGYNGYKNKNSIPGMSSTPAPTSTPSA